TDMLSIFSLADIFTLGALVQGNLINNIDNFVFGVVTFDGTYLLGIENVNSFLNYFSSNQIDPTNENHLNLYSVEYDNIYVKPDNSPSQNEIGILNFIKDKNLGISLKKGDLANFNAWDKIGVNRSGNNTIILECK
ncbi:hypothetical protein, partial [Mongoliitalea lutea]